MQMPRDFDWDHVAYWKHYKGGKYILCEDSFAWMEEDMDKEDMEADMKEVVVYKSIDNSGRPYVRRRAYFFGDVEMFGRRVPRFRAVTWREAARELLTAATDQDRRDDE